MVPTQRIVKTEKAIPGQIDFEKGGRTQKHIAHLKIRPKIPARGLNGMIGRQETSPEN